MKTTIAIALGLFWLHCSAETDPYFIGRNTTPYPPGCITVPARQIDLYGDNVVRFWGGSMWLEVVHKVESRDPNANLGLVTIDMYRVGCSEPGRSVILAEFRLPSEWVDPRNSQLVLPWAGGSWAWDPIPFEFKAEPNAWGTTREQEAISLRAIGDYSGGWLDARHFAWRYVLDVPPVGTYWTAEFLTEYYNSRFWLELYRNGPFGVVGFEVPATTDVLEPNPSLPLNGRLSGIWVEPGTGDQGFLLSFGNPVETGNASVADARNADLSAFLTWFTYDANGDSLWLAGSARFPQGSSEVSIPLVQVGQGEFMGRQAAERRIVGQLRLTARHCNAIAASYDLAVVGLGAGDMILQRLEALEIAGYPCRDFAARRASLSSQPGN